MNRVHTVILPFPKINCTEIVPKGATGRYAEKSLLPRPVLCLCTGPYPSTAHRPATAAVLVALVAGPVAALVVALAVCRWVGGNGWW